ncbi:accessory factor UbiK family protein [Sandaracinobacter sp. RS1-74]|uniref:accessory factor UbiK family protein n=1 Tax=Sandaracinobacteroides sayramensis TaxID=2913411 RepID=UPI001EDAB9B6|nr:accessory factor UbiK family protein [Sandaracinobacteroides sayramensis]MCG2839371.1 accessory factor UbiK family protein [Sandaracinobacteroides sayramensis]
MQNQNQVFEDLSRLMSSLAGTVAGAGREAETRMKEKLREAVGGIDMVSREEFEVVKAMAAEAKAELEALKAELEALRSSIPGGSAAQPARVPRARASKIDIS